MLLDSKGFGRVELDLSYNVYLLLLYYLCVFFFLVCNWSIKVVLFILK